MLKVLWYMNPSGNEQSNQVESLLHSGHPNLHPKKQCKTWKIASYEEVEGMDAYHSNDFRAVHKGF